VALILAIAITLGGVATLYLSWRHSHRWKALTVPAGWLLLGLSALAWIGIGGPELGVAYAAMAMAFVAWSLISVGREPRRQGERRSLSRLGRKAPAWPATARTIARLFVALILAGTASLLASVLLVAGLPWATANRYVFAIMVAPIIWGLLAMWVGMTEKLSRVAILLVGVSAVCSALLLVV